MRMWVYAARRAALLVPLLLGVVTVTFVVSSFLPVADRTAPYASVSTGPYMGPPSCTPGGCGPYIDPNASSFIALGQPVPVQWAVYVYHTLTFQWGHVASRSLLGEGNAGFPAFKGQPVVAVLAEFLPYSLELVLLALLFTLLVVLPVRTRATLNPGQTADHIGRILTLLGFGIPGFFLGVVLLNFVASVWAGSAASGPSLICPSGTVFLELYGSWPVPHCAIWGTPLAQSGYPVWLVNGYQSTPTGFPTLDALLHGDGWLALDTLFRMLLPALVIALGAIAAVLRLPRYATTHRIDLEFVRAARAKGLPESDLLRKHARQYSLVELLAVLGPAFLVILGSLPILETVFNLDGVGRLFVLSLSTSGGTYDFGIAFGVVLVAAFLTLVANWVLDVVRAYLDPRLRLEPGRMA